MNERAPHLDVDRPDAAASVTGSADAASAAGGNDAAAGAGIQVEVTAASPASSALHECGPASPAQITHAKGAAALRARLAGPATVKTNAMLVVLMASTFSGSFAQAMMNIALPHVADSFSVSLAMANWIVVGYTIVAATAITMAAALLSRYGLRRMFGFCCGCLIVGSVVGLFTVNFPMLVGARLIQAIASGLLYPTVTGVIALLVGPERRGTVLAINAGAIGAGQAIGPLVSGLLLTNFNLHIMFLPPIILGIGVFIAGLMILRNVEDRADTPIDILSVILSFAGLAAFMYGLGEITHQPLEASIGLIIGGIILVIFNVRQIKIKTPLLNLKPLKNPAFTFGIVLVMLGMMATASMSLLLPLFYEGTAGDTAFLAGLLIAGPLFVYAIVSIIGGKIFDKHGVWPLVPVGFVLIIIGFITVFIAGDDRLVAAVFGLSFLIYGGVGLVVAPSKTKALNELSHDLYSHGAAINSVFVQVANAFGSSLFVGVLSSDVQHGVASGLSRPDAYAAGFAHTLIISIVLCAIAIVISIIYSLKLRNKIHP